MNRYLWAVRRELWARMTWIAPVALGGIIVLAVLFAALVTRSISIQGLDADKLAEIHEKMTPENIAAIVSVVLGVITVPFFGLLTLVQLFYGVDALYGERRDRSVLFWKSLPVSDATTVLSKLTVVGLIMPAAAAAAALVTQFLLIAIVSAKAAPLGFLHSQQWMPAIWGGNVVVLLYAVLTSAIWSLPVLGWYLLVSARVPRSPLLYATVLPLLAALAEYIALHSNVVWRQIIVRPVGFVAHAFGPSSFNIVIEKGHLEIPRSLFDTMRPLEFLSSPQVWIGVAVGAVFVWGAIWVRRTRDEAA